MDRLIEDFLKDCRIRGMASRTVLHYMYCLKAFQEHLDGVNLLSVDKEVLKGFIEHLRGMERSQKTIENIFSVLSSFYKYLVFEGRVVANPILPIRERYLRSYKNNGPAHERKLISIEIWAG